MALKNDGHDVIFIGTEHGMEKDLIPKAGFEIKFIHASGLNSGITSKIKAIHNLNKGVVECMNIIRDEAPNLVIGTGGYVTAPLIMAGINLKIPTVIHESNALPGKTTKLLATRINKVLVGFSETKEKLRNASNVVVTGNPNKMGLNTLSKQEAKEKISINGKLLLIFGGSQGAKKINETIVKIIKDNKFDGYSVIYATGPNNYEEIKSSILTNNEEYEIDENEDEIKLYNKENSSFSLTFTSNKEGIKKEVKSIVNDNKKEVIIVKKFIYNMEEVMKASDLVVCRSGALTISEISEVGVASILIPFPYAAENHQFFNAKTLENVDAGVIIEEKNLMPDILLRSIDDIIKNDEKISKMAENSKKIKVGQNAIENIKKEIYEIIKK